MHSKIRWRKLTIYQFSSGKCFWLSIIAQFAVAGNRYYAHAEKSVINVIWVQLSSCWLPHHNDWSRWFASSSPPPLCCPSFSFMGGVAKKEITEWGCAKYFCRVTYWAWCSKSISIGTQYVTLDNKIKCLSSAFWILGSPTNKTVTGTAYMWGLLVANHLDQSSWSTNQKYWAAVRSNLLHSFLEVHTCVVPLPATARIWCKKTNFLI
jgi:hypothetical protein